MDAVSYLLRSGCSWRMLPREYPAAGRPTTTTPAGGSRRTAQKGARPAAEGVREAEGRDRDPCAAVIDSQVVKTTRVGGPERGYDGTRSLAGRKSHILVDNGPAGIGR